MLNSCFTYICRGILSWLPIEMKKLCIVLLALTLVQIASAQEETEEKKGFRKENLFIGGNFGLTIGDYTLINISPQVGYRFNKYVAAGAGINAQYASEKQRNYSGDVIYRDSRGILGLNVFGRVYPLQYIMLQVQPEANYIFGRQKYYDNNQTLTTDLDAEIVPSLLLGGGAVLPSGRSSLVIAVFWDALYDPNKTNRSPYGKRPFLTIGYNINLH